MASKTRKPDNSRSKLAKVCTALAASAVAVGSVTVPKAVWGTQDRSELQAALSELNYVSALGVVFLGVLALGFKTVAH